MEEIVAATGRATAKSDWGAFLSYSSHDGEAVGRVQRFVERYRLPGGGRIRVYRDETDIAGGELPEQLQKALGESSCLVVCCSAAAAESHWVAREIEAFRELAPGRPILPLLIAGEPPVNLPPPLRALELRWSDLRAGWRWGRPRRTTRVELVRVVAAAAGMDFRKLLPLDRRRRRLKAMVVTAIIALALAVTTWFPVQDWEDVTPEGIPVFGSDTLDDGIAFYRFNEQTIMEIFVWVQRNVFGPAPQSERLGDDILPRGRLLPGPVNTQIQRRCGSTGADWVGEPEPGTCVKVSESEEIGFIGDHMGGAEAPLTDVAVRNHVFVLDRFWRRIDLRAWEAYGRTVHPSMGLPITADGNDLWLGFPAEADRGNFIPGSLWHTVDGGSTWEAEQDISDVHSVRHLRLGVMVAARKNGELGFFLRRNGVFKPFDVPGKGDDIEICGEVDGQPVVRADRKVYRRVLLPWWRTWLD